MSKPLIVKSKSNIEKLRKYAIENNLPENIYEDFQIYAEEMVPKWGSDNLNWEWFHKYICKCYNGILTGEIDYLTLETHSQVGKSVLTALFITYIFGLSPDKQIMYFTHNEVSATKFTKSYIFYFMSSDKYRLIFPYVVLKNEISKDDHSSKVSMKKKIATLQDNQFTIINPFVAINKEYRGSFIALGIGQGSHGKPADIMILDDYVNKAENVKSETYRTMLEDSLNSDIFLRFQANTKFLIICTRWYERDPIGIMSEKMPDVIRGYEEMGMQPPIYKSVKIRAEYRTSDDNPPEDPRTYNGEWLWKEMLGKYLLAKGGKEGKYFNATFNCDPTDINLEYQLTLDNFEFYNDDQLPKVGLIFYSIDCASTDKARSNKTAVGKWLVQGRRRFLLKLWLFKKTTLDMMRSVDGILNEDHYDKCLIEYTSGGIALCQYLSEKKMKHTPLSFSGRELSDNVKKPESFKEKTTRSNSKMDRYMRTVAEIGNKERLVYLPSENIEHIDEFIKQVTTFTGADNKDDDMVDMFTHFINYTSRRIIVYNPTMIKNEASSYDGSNPFGSRYFNDN